MSIRAVRINTAKMYWATILIVALPTLASDPAPGWSNKWDANVWNSYCELRLEYYLPYRNDPRRRGFLANRSFDRLFAQFTSSTQTHPGPIPKEELSEIRFGLLFYGEDGHDPEPEDRITAVSIGNFKMAPAEMQSIAGVLAFTLDEEESLLLLELFKQNKTVEVAVIFADGEERQSKIYPGGDKDFRVWAAMFRACVRENVGPR